MGNMIDMIALIEWISEKKEKPKKNLQVVNN